MVGYTLEELGAIHIDLFQKLLYPKDVQPFNNKVSDHLEKKSDCLEVDFRFFHKKGAIMWIRARGKVIN